tara:strand:+ start:3313 stop:3603 length:291 start_codon:yes stop_codon:yes gene_type:complete
LNKDILNHLQTITQKLPLENKDNLQKIYLEVNNGNERELINLGNFQNEDSLENIDDYLLIKMNESTFFELKNNIKHPEDLMFEEKIKIKGNLNLLK